MHTEEPATPDQHILYRDGTWAVMPDGAAEPIRTFDSREEALR